MTVGVLMRIHRRDHVIPWAGRRESGLSEEFARADEIADAPPAAYAGVGPREFRESAGSSVALSVLVRSSFFGFVTRCALSLAEAEENGRDDARNPKIYCIRMRNREQWMSCLSLSRAARFTGVFHKFR